VLTNSIQKALMETNRRRTVQLEYNTKHGITPTTIVKPIKEKIVEITDTKHIPKKDIPVIIVNLELEMQKAADDLDFEKAIALRDRINKLKHSMML